jgi:RNA:NAD 2'-phosphotransferase (TPT1/KptA family)
VPKVLNLLKAFQNRRDCQWPAFKSGVHYAAHCSKENCSSATYLLDFKIGEIASCPFSKALGAILRHLASNRSKEFENAGFEKLSENSKALGATANNSLIQYQIKGTVQEIMNIC